MGARCWYLYHTWTISTIWKSSQVKCKLFPTKGRMPAVRTLLSTYRYGKAWADNQGSRGRERGHLDLSATFWKYKACFLLQWLYECTWIPSRKACYIVKTLRKLLFRQICTPRYHVQNLERLTDWTNHAHRPYVIWCSYKSATHIQKKSPSSVLERWNMIVRVSVILNKTCCWQWVTFQQPLRAVVIFRVKVSWITSVDGIKLLLWIWLVN